MVITNYKGDVFKIGEKVKLITDDSIRYIVKYEGGGLVYLNSLKPDFLMMATICTNIEKI